MSDLEFGGRFDRVSAFFDWPVRLVAANLLWILGVLAGVVVAGLAPASLAMYSLLREYLLGRRPRLWHDFWATWRRAMTSSQLVIGLPMLTVVVVGFYLFASRGTPFVFAMTVVAVGYLATLLQLPAVAVSLNLPVTDTWKATIAIAWRQPLHTLGAAILIVAMMVGAWFVAPAALPLFFPALPALLASLIVCRGLQASPHTH